MIETIKYNLEHKKAAWIVLLLILVLILFLVVALFTRAYLAPIPDTPYMTAFSVSNCAEVNLLSEQDTISRSLDYPRNDGDGMLTTPYQFTIANTCSSAATVNIYLVIPTVPSNAIALSNIKMSLNEATPVTLDSLTSKSLSSTYQNQFNIQTGLVYSSAKQITSVTLPPQSTTYAMSFRLRLWISSEAVISNSGRSFAGVIMVADSGA